MSCRSIGLLICMFTAVSLATLYRDPDFTTEWSVTESVREAMQEAGEELGALLDAGDGAVITLEAGGTRLAVHRAVLAARSPALASMLPHHSAEAGGGLSVPDMEGPVLRRLLAYLYTLRAPRLPPGAATQLLAAAHRLGLPALQADCERQVAEQLSVETAASAAVLAVRLALTDLRDAAVNFIEDHFIEVLATKGWANAVENQPTEVIKLTLLLAGRMAKSGAPATTEAETSTSIEVRTTTTTEAGTTASTQPHSASQTPATAAPPLAACPTAPLDEDTVSRLRSHSGENRDRRLMRAAKEGAVGELRALLAAGADVAAREKYRRTALHWAAARGRVEAASCLLAAGAQVDARDMWQHTPLQVATLFGHVAVARLLLAASADPNSRNDEGETPLHTAAWWGHAEAASCLLGAGAQVDARERWQWTPLHEAAMRGHAAVARLLLAASADPNARSDEGDTPLHMTAISGSAEVARLLLAASADPNARDHLGLTPLHWAAMSDRAEVAAVLLEAGADRGARDAAGRTPLYYARSFNYQHLIDMLTQR